MAKQSPIRERARRDLVFTDQSGNQDLFLWEHSLRVARSALHIATLPGVPAHRLDLQALEAAALYHEAGWVCQYHDRLIDRYEVLGRPTSDVQYNLAATMLAESLSALLKPRSLECAIMLVRQLNDQHIRAAEAQILSDADNLDDIGGLSLWSMIRRHTFDGKGIEATLQTWQRQCEFRFWEARVNKSIRLDPVKRLAAQRLRELDSFMNTLARHHAGEDLAAVANHTTQASVDPITQ